MLIFKILFLIGGKLLYNVVLVSAIQQHESAIGIQMSPPFGTSLPPPTLSTPPGCHGAPGLSSLHHTADSHLLIPIPFSRDLPDPGIKPRSPALAGRFSTV